MAVYVPVINAFIEDTCVLIVIAYLLARGRLLGLLFPSHADSRQKALLGIVLGIVGFTEIIFPGARAPYVAHSLLITFATLLGGLSVGLISAAFVILGAVALQTTANVFDTCLTLLTSAVIAEMVRQLFVHRSNLMRGLVAGMGAQTGVVLLHQVGVLHRSHSLSHLLLGIPANGFGVLLLQLVCNEARTRADSERNRIDAERSHALVAEAQLVALRARIHPHFLFNALTSIAALCNIAPVQAEAATLRLSQLMRRALESDAADPKPFSIEVEFVRGYLEIEQHRLGNRLTVLWEIADSTKTILVPTFALQTLVENAVSHGIAPKMGEGTIRIVARSHARHTLIAVTDNGVGMTPSDRHRALAVDGNREHGLRIVTQQLSILYGENARLRLFSQPDGGTIAAFRVPNPPVKKNVKGTPNAHSVNLR